MNQSPNLNPKTQYNLQSQVFHQPPSAYQLPEHEIQKFYKSIQLQRSDCSPNLAILASGLTVQGQKGFRSVRASYGVWSGTFYFEVYWHPKPALITGSTLPSTDDPTKPRPVHLIPTQNSVLYPSSAGLAPVETQIRLDLIPDMAQLTEDPLLFRAQDPHLRVGFGLWDHDMNLPVGYALDSFAYRDVNGEKVCNSIPENYGSAFRPGDVIGCLIHIPQDAIMEDIGDDYNKVVDKEDLLKIVRGENNNKFRPDGSVIGEDGSTVPPGVLPFPSKDPTFSLGAVANSRHDAIPVTHELVNQQLSAAQDREPIHHPISGSFIEFFKNGVSQGVAFTELLGGRCYFPQISLFQHATATVNFGPDYAFPPQAWCRLTNVLTPRDFDAGDKQIVCNPTHPLRVFNDILKIDAFYRVLYNVQYTQIPSYQVVQDHQRLLAEERLRTKQQVNQVKKQLKRPKKNTKQTAKSRRQQQQQQQQQQNDDEHQDEQHKNNNTDHPHDDNNSNNNTQQQQQQPLDLIREKNLLEAGQYESDKFHMHHAPHPEQPLWDRLKYLEPHNYMNIMGYMTFPVLSTTSYSLRISPYYWLEKHLIRRDALVRFYAATTARYGRPVVLPPDIIQKFDIRPYLKQFWSIAQRYRIPGIPHLKPNPRAKEPDLWFDDVIVPVTTPADFIEEEIIHHFSKITNRRDCNLLIALQLRYKNIRCDDLTGDLVDPNPHYAAVDFEEMLLKQQQDQKQNENNNNNNINNTYDMDNIFLEKGRELLQAKTPQQKWFLHQHYLKLAQKKWLHFLQDLSLLFSHHDQQIQDFVVMRANARWNTLKALNDTAYDQFLMTQNVQDKIAAYKEQVVAELRMRLGERFEVNRAQYNNEVLTKGLPQPHMPPHPLMDGWMKQQIARRQRLEQNRTQLLIHNEGKLAGRMEQYRALEILQAAMAGKPLPVLGSTLASIHDAETAAAKEKNNNNNNNNNNSDSDSDDESGNNNNNNNTRRNNNNNNNHNRQNDDDKDKLQDNNIDPLSIPPDIFPNPLHQLNPQDATPLPDPRVVLRPLFNRLMVSAQTYRMQKNTRPLTPQEIGIMVNRGNTIPPTRSDTRAAMQQQQQQQQQPQKQNKTTKTNEKKTKTNKRHVG